jgi:hypothetical protein
VLARRSREPVSVLAIAVGAPAAAVGVAFASPAVLALGGVLASAALARGGRPFTAGVVAGATAAITPFAIFAAPLALAPANGGARRRTAVLGLAGVAAGLLGTLVAPVLGRTFYILDNGLPGWPGTGVGLGPLLAYRGAESSAAVLAWVLPVAVLAVAAILWRTSPSVHAVGVAVLAGLWTALDASPHALAVPLALFVLGAGQRSRELVPGTS